MDITYTKWHSDQQVLAAGHRGFETVVGLYDATSETFTEVWSGQDLTTGWFYVTVSRFNTTGDCVLVDESSVRAPEIAVIREGEYRTVKSFDLHYADQVKAIDAVERVSWRASDELEIQGWLPRPNDRAPYCMYTEALYDTRVTCSWVMGRLLLVSLKRGYAIVLPNPRGGSGREQDFARQVLGEIGGADTYACLSAPDRLVRQGVADSAKLGVTGASYGGLMSSWLITQDSRFAATMSVAPHTNQVSEHLLSNIPHFMALFLADRYTNPGGKYFQRSPIMHAHKVKTPTHKICGAQDRCTPPEDAAQFRSLLLENSIESVLINCPEEGHGIRKSPAAIDFAARVVTWLEKHIGTEIRHAGETLPP